MTKTIFQKIIDKEIIAEFLYEDDQCICIKDIEPQAPVHCLIIPKKPIERIAAVEKSDIMLLGHLMFVASKVAKELQIDKSGFRIVINNGKDGGESVPHLHIHLLGGRSLQWPPG